MRSVSVVVSGCSIGVWVTAVADFCRVWQIEYGLMGGSLFVGHLFFVTQLTIQQIAQKTLATGGRLHPGPINQRWVVPHVLSVSTSKDGPPIPHLIQFKLYNGLLHTLTWPYHLAGGLAA